MNNLFKDDVLTTSKREFINEIVERCIREMYAKAQPKGDYDEILKLAKDNKIKEEYPEGIYNYYYLSQEEFNYIKDKYINVFCIANKWKPDCDLLIDNVVNGGHVDDYVEATETRLGYRIAKEIPPFAKLIEEKFGISEDTSDAIVKMLAKTMEGYKDFYKFDNNEETFNINICLGASPTSNKQTVIDNWKKKGVDIEIKDRDSRRFWYEDNGWSEEDIQEELNDIDELPE